MTAEPRGSASLAVVPGSGLSHMPAEIQELGQKGGCSRFGREQTQMPPGVRGSDKRRCEKTKRLLSVTSCRKGDQIQSFTKESSSQTKQG